MNWERLLHIGALSYFVLCFFSSLLLPTWLSNPLDNVLFPIALLHFARVFLTRRELRLYFSLFLLLCSIGFISELFNKETLVFGNVTSILLILKFPVLISCLIENSVILKQEERVHFSLDLIFILLVAFNLILAVNPFGLGFTLQEFFVPKSYSNFVYYQEWGTYRLTGIYSNPNNNALVFACFMFYYLTARSGRLNFAVLAIAMVLLTQSRTIFVASLIIGAILILRSIQWKSITKYKYWLIAGVIASLLFVIASPNLRSLFSLEAFTSHSFQYRIQNFQAIEAGNKFWLGSGVVSDPFKTYGIYFDSEFIAVMIQFGLLGLCALLAIFCVGIFLRVDQSKRMAWIVLSTLLVFASFTNTTVLNAQVAVVPASFLGLILFLAKSRTEPIKNPEINPR